jgi:hypothetical protein
MTTSHHSTVYVLETPDLPGIVKIGFTSRSTLDRLLEINQLSFFKAHRPFAVLISCRVKNAHSVEQLTHRILSRYRLPGSGELFAVNAKAAMNSIYTAAGMVNRNGSRAAKQDYTLKRKSVAQMADEVQRDIEGGKLDRVHTEALAPYSNSRKTRSSIIAELVRRGVLTKHDNGRVSIAA